MVTMPAFRLGPLCFTLGLHALLALLILAAPQLGTSVGETVYQVSLAPVSPACGAPILSAPAAAPVSDQAPAPPSEALAPITAQAETPPSPDAAQETSPAPLPPLPPLPLPLPEEKPISAKTRPDAPPKTPAPHRKPTPRRQTKTPTARPAQQEKSAAAQAAGAGESTGMVETAAASGLRQVGGFAAYNADAVDQAPAIARKILPDYPVKARRLDLQGRVIVRLVVDTAGNPQVCAIQEATPPGYFDDAALDAARRTRFIPGKRQGRAVNTVVLLPFTFSLH
jgi:protein TonB